MRAINQFFLIMILSASAIAVSPIAEEICFRNSTEFSNLKAQLPTLFRQLPLVIGTEAEGIFLDVYVVLKIYIVNEAIVLESDSWRGIGRYSDTNEIRKICFNNKADKLIIVFTNNKEFKATYTETEVRVPGAVLKIITPEQQSNISRKINEKDKKFKPSKVNQ